MLPGTALILAAAVLHGAATGFEAVSPAVIAVLAGITLLSYFLDYVAGVIGAQRAGASRWGIAGSLAGTLVGLVLFSLPGMLIGMFAGAALCEWAFAGRDWRAALRAGGGSLLGMLAGVLAKFVMAVAMIAIFFWSVSK
ncbi:MAG: DUF456 domain-containing protein [Candidatus Tectomicrobia bacterium]|nr:DUF456 domain-containing protein [Candidatus Tectomicrobia bacterium]